MQYRYHFTIAFLLKFKGSKKKNTKIQKCRHYKGYNFTYINKILNPPYIHILFTQRFGTISTEKGKKSYIICFHIKHNIAAAIRSQWFLCSAYSL